MLKDTEVLGYSKAENAEMCEFCKRITELADDKADLLRKVEQLENEAVWLSMRLGHYSVPGKKPMAKMHNTRARYWREAARSSCEKLQLKH